MPTVPRRVRPGSGVPPSEPVEGGVVIDCPFIRAVAEGRIAAAEAMAAAPPDPAEPVVIDWLIAEARRQLQEP